MALPNNPNQVVPEPAFTQTAWNVVSRVSRGDHEAREQIARRYWYPLYAYLRRKGQSPEDASDLVQGSLGALFGLEQLGEPDAVYDRALAKSILQEACEELRLDLESRGKGLLFGMLSAALDNMATDLPFADVSQKSGLLPGAMKAEVLRLRKSYVRRITDLLAGDRAQQGPPLDAETELREFYAALYS